jgi:hypothetical protein
MSEQRALRFGGSLLLAGGVLYSLYRIVHPALPRLPLDPVAYRHEHVMGLMGQLALLVGLPAVVAVAAGIGDRHAGLSIVFTLVCLSMAMFFVSSVEAFVWLAIGPGALPHAHGLAEIAFYGPVAIAVAWVGLLLSRRATATS